MTPPARDEHSQREVTTDTVTGVQRERVSPARSPEVQAPDFLAAQAQQLAQAEQERDEGVQIIAVQQAAIAQAEQTVAQLTRERDEARETIRQMEDQDAVDRYDRR
jgi:hypothetical protein